jgi:hypothetical protein
MDHQHCRIPVLERILGLDGIPVLDAIMGPSQRLRPQCAPVPAPRNRTCDTGRPAQPLQRYQSPFRAPIEPLLFCLTERPDMLAPGLERDCNRRFAPWGKKVRPLEQPWLWP